MTLISEKQIIKHVERKAFIGLLKEFYIFDLLFKDYANKLASKKHQVASSLKILLKTIRGVNGATIRKLVHVFIFLILVYAAPAWWSCSIWVNRERRTIQNNIENSYSMSDKVWNIALLEILFD